MVKLSHLWLIDFDKDAKTSHWGNNGVSTPVVLGKMDAHM